MDCCGTQAWIATRAPAAWALRQEPPAWDPERSGQWAGSIAQLSGEEKARRIALEIDNARRGFWYQRVYDLAAARRYPGSVVDRAVRLLSALDDRGGGSRSIVSGRTALIPHPG